MAGEYLCHDDHVLIQYISSTTSMYVLLHNCQFFTFTYYITPMRGGQVSTQVAVEVWHFMTLLA